MHLHFKKVTLCNFLSFGTAEIDLENKQYCLVRGINQNPKDNALSNGAGKSSWSSAICWALTGETINGLSKNIKNINVEEKTCFVTLEFSVDNCEYIVTRYAEPKSDLKIIKDGSDISGKGIRESEKILAEYLPDLNSQLISSIIILGQGLPNKFSANTPSGRKDVLEKLSRSDFMIQDLKDRIGKRSTQLNEQLNKHNLDLAGVEAEKKVYEKQLTDYQEKLAELEKPVDFDESISILNKEILETEAKIKENDDFITKKEEEISGYNSIFVEKSKQKADDSLKENNRFDEIRSRFMEVSANYKSDIRSLNNEITKLKSVKDVCPTCGQKLPNVIKQDTSGLEAEVEQLTKELNEATSKYNTLLFQHNEVINAINESFNSDTKDLNNKIQEGTVVLNTKKNTIKNELNTKLLNLKNNLTTTEAAKNSHEEAVKAAKKAVEDTKNCVENSNSKILYINNDITIVQDHIKVINQMNTLIKRDFRGYLLSNIITFIDMKAKEYSLQLFGSDNLKFELDGNDIDIFYCDKPFENLSGGEKQKVDLIIQFAIRDMMKQYLGFSSNILVLDELTDNLDATGCTNLMNMISSKITDVESIFIISHHADELEIATDTELVIIKNAEGVSKVLC